MTYGPGLATIACDDRREDREDREAMMMTIKLVMSTVAPIAMMIPSKLKAKK